jgi:tetratricopeptide (TPR) repeat protein/predicted GTPase
MKTKEEDNKEKILSEVSKLITEGNARIQEEDKGIVLLGKTGAGKSTLTYLLAQQPLKATLDKATGNIIINAVTPLENIKISHDAVSGTQIPNKYTTNGITLWDCPGFNDTAGIAQEIANAFYIRKLFDATKNLKFILVISEASLGNKAIDFIAIVDQFTKSFTDIRPLQNSVSLVITQAKAKKEVHHIKTVIENLSEQNLSIEANTKEMLQFLLKSVHIFHEPAEGEVLTNSTLFKTINDSMSYIEKKDGLANVTISPKSLMYAKDLLEAAHINVNKIVNIIVTAASEANKCIMSDNNNIFINSYDTIKDWLPASIQYIDVPMAPKPTAYFIELDQLHALRTAFKAFENMPQGNNKSYEAIPGFFKALEIFEMFAEKAETKQKMQAYAHVFSQQLEYIKVFSALCNTPVTYHNSINDMAQKCMSTINDALTEKIKMIQLDHSHIKIEYYEQAIKYFEVRPLECTDITAEAYSHIGRIYQSRSNVNKALLNYMETIKLNPKSYPIYEKIGNILLNQEYYMEAMKYFKVINDSSRVLQCFDKLNSIWRNVDNAQIKIDKGDYCISIGRYEKAIKCYQEAFSLTSNLDLKTTIYEKIGNILKNQGDKGQQFIDKANNKDFYNLNEINKEMIGQLENRVRMLLTEDDKQIESNDIIDYDCEVSVIGSTNVTDSV